MVTQYIFPDGNLIRWNLWPIVDIVKKTDPEAKRVVRGKDVGDLLNGVL